MNKKTGKKTGKRNAHIPPTAMSYNGPIRLYQPRGIVVDDSIEVQAMNSATLSSSAAGVLATVFDSQVQLAASADVAEYQSLYSEYRLLAIEIEFLPTHYVNTTGGIIRDAIYCIQDRQSATALTSVGNALAYSDSVTIHKGGSAFKCCMRMSGPGESSWISTASSPAAADRLYIKYYSVGNTASVTLGTYVARMVVQYRNRQ